MSSVAIWTNISVFRQLVAELAAALGGRGKRASEALGEPFPLEDAQRRFGRTALRRHPRAQLRRRLAALGRELRRAKHSVCRELERVGFADARLLGKLRELLDQP